MADRWRPAWADIDLDALRHNAGVLATLTAPAALCAVVKADGYGHGALPVARAALEGGATWLAVALVEEGVNLREAGIEAPILLLSEPPVEGMAEAVARGLVPTLYTRGGIASLSRVVAERGVPPVAVHLKVDTGMHRVGADPDEACGLAEAIDADPHLVLGAVWTHLAVADGTSPEDLAFSALQLERFDPGGEYVSRYLGGPDRPDRPGGGTGPGRSGRLFDLPGTGGTPVVDHARERVEALARFAEARGRADH